MINCEQPAIPQSGSHTIRDGDATNLQWRLAQPFKQCVNLRYNKKFSLPNFQKVPLPLKLLLPLLPNVWISRIWVSRILKPQKLAHSQVMNLTMKLMMKITTKFAMKFA